MINLIDYNVPSHSGKLTGGKQTGLYLDADLTRRVKNIYHITGIRNQSAIIRMLLRFALDAVEQENPTLKDKK